MSKKKQVKRRQSTKWTMKPKGMAPPQNKAKHRKTEYKGLKLTEVILWAVQFFISRKISSKDKNGNNA